MFSALYLYALIVQIHFNCCYKYLEKNCMYYVIWHYSEKFVCIKVQKRM